MPKKVIDIFPPQKLEKYQLLLSSNEGEFSKEALVFPERKKKRGFKKGLLFISLFLIPAFIFLHFFFVRAKIEIWPEIENFSLNERIVIDGKTDKLDLKTKIIPGKIFEIEKTISGEFSSSGRFLKKAEGVIRLYNAYTVQSGTWQQGTKFVSSEGKLFLAKNKINVPGAKIKNGKLTPSFVDVPVVAAEGGSDYNIGSSHFSVFAYRGTPKYIKFYGQSFQPMTGGGKSLQVTKEDLEKAENILIEKVKAELETALKNEIPDGFVFLSKALETKILEKSSSVDVGAEAEKFNFQVKAKSTNISFRSKDIEDFAVLSILAQISSDKELYRQSVKINYLLETVNLELGSLTLSLNGSAKIYPKIDFDSLKKALVGKSLAETNILLDNQPGIARSEIQVFPFWLRSISNNLEKIRIEIRID